jgi:hypothetical protein
VLSTFDNLNLREGACWAVAAPLQQGSLSGGAMGCSASKPVNPIDIKLVGALRAYKAQHSGHNLTFNELLLHFPQASAHPLHTG